MITRFITEVNIKKSGKVCRLLLAQLPANARQLMRINAKVLPKGSQESSLLALKFSELRQRGGRGKL